MSIEPIVLHLGETAECGGCGEQITLKQKGNSIKWYDSRGHYKCGNDPLFPVKVHRPNVD